MISADKLALIAAVQWLIAESGLDLKEKVSEAGEPPRPSFWGLEKEEVSPDHTQRQTEIATQNEVKPELART